MTTALAVWGAVVSTVTLIWNLWKWQQEKPRVVAKATTFGFSQVEGIRFEIRNRGGRPTTIEDVRLVNYMRGVAGLFRMPARIEYLARKYEKTINLPVLLQPGAVWTADVPLKDRQPGPFDDDRAQLIKDGRLFFKVCCAHTERRVVGKVLAEDFNPWAD